MFWCNLCSCISKAEWQVKYKCVKLIISIYKFISKSKMLTKEILVNLRLTNISLSESYQVRTRFSFLVVGYSKWNTGIRNVHFLKMKSYLLLFICPLSKVLITIKAKVLIVNCFRDNWSTGCQDFRKRNAFSTGQ